MPKFTVGVSRDFKFAPFDPRQFTPCAHVCGSYETRYIKCDKPVRGRFVVVYGEERGQIQMCEFEVYANQTTGKYPKM